MSDGLHHVDESAKKDAYSEAFARYYPLMYSVVYSSLDNTDAADDVCQDIFLAFFENFSGIENHRKWLYGTMRNVLLNHYKKKRNMQVDIDTVLDEAGMTFVNGFRDARIIIKDIIESDQPFEFDDDKMIFELVALYGFSYNQTAEQLGITKRKVQYRYNLITGKILDSLSKKGIGHIEDLL